MYFNLLFAVCVAVVYAEPLLTRVAGKAATGVLLVLSAVGLCSLVALFAVEAL